MDTVDCTQFKDGACLHQAAPRALFGCAKCVEVYNPYTNAADPRLPKVRCTLKVHKAPPIPPSQSKKVKNEQIYRYRISGACVWQFCENQPSHGGEWDLLTTTPSTPMSTPVGVRYKKADAPPDALWRYVDLESLMAGLNLYTCEVIESLYLDDKSNCKP